MIPDERWLRTRQVALALGVSVSTIKRWVDAGLLRARRTVGKHRLIAQSDAREFARKQGLEWAYRDDSEREGRVRDRLFAALREGRAPEARTLIEAIHAAHGAAALADEWVRPVMEQVGHGWSDGALDVYHEHQATQIIARAVAALIEREAARSAGAGLLALGATVAGDPYTLSLLLGELLLRESGWDVRSLGPDLPLDSLAKAVDGQRPALVFLSVNHLTDPNQFVNEYWPVHETAGRTGAAVFLGGPALTPDLRARLVCAGFGDRMVHLAEFARRLSHRTAASAPERVAPR
jgi:excisionase family DNA binding protein